MTQETTGQLVLLQSLEGEDSRNLQAKWSRWLRKPAWIYQGQTMPD